MKLLYLLLFLSFALNVVLLIIYIHIRRVYHSMIRRSLATENTKNELVDRVSYETALTSNEQERWLLKSLQRIMETDRLYLDSELDMQGLAKKVGTNKNTLSHVINTCLRMNFASFLNYYRVCDAIKILSDSQYANYKIEAVGEMCGFNSRQVFHAAFKRATGITPTHFRNANKKH